jgi:hypothetical protein
MRHIIGFILLVGWIAGIVIAKGFWSTTFAIFMPLWSYYLVVERLVEKFL